MFFQPITRGFGVIWFFLGFMSNLIGFVLGVLLDTGLLSEIAFYLQLQGFRKIHQILIRGGTPEDSLC